MAYANLVDNEEVEASTFELTGDSVIVQDNQASVVVRRTGGISQYASVYVGTEEGTAISGKDYVPGLQELFFTPGMTEQTVTVDILNNPNRESDREFTIALDRKNKNVNTKKAAVSVILPTDTKAQPVKMQAFQAGIMTLPTRTYAKGVEKISPYGFSPREGQWAVVGKDFTSGWTKGNVSTNNDWLYLMAKGGESYARANNVKLYGVDSVYFDGENTGCGHHWTTGWWIFSDDHEEHEFNTKFQIKNTAGTVSTLWEKKGNVGYQGSKELSVPKSLWDTEYLGFYTWAKSKNQSTANIDWLRLTLHEYEVKMEDAPEFQVHEYNIEGGKLEKGEALAIGRPGYLTIKKVSSNVNNTQSYNEKTDSAKVFRSDKIELKEVYLENQAGSSAVYKGFEVFINNRWVKYNGTILNLDAAFFAQGGIPDVIKVRPVFEHREAEFTIKANTTNGYIQGLGPDTQEKAFGKLKKGDIVKASTVNNLSVTPKWSSNRELAKLDADTKVECELAAGQNWLYVNFTNPTLIVKAHPKEYLHHVSKPRYSRYYHRSRCRHGYDQSIH